MPQNELEAHWHDGPEVEIQHLVTPKMLPSAEETADRLRLRLSPHAAHRCVGVDWRSRSCHFRRLCLDPSGAEGPLSAGEFLYFADPALGRAYASVPMSVALNSGVTSGAQRYGPEWAPRVVEGSIPGDARLVRGGPHVLLTEYNFANPMLVVADFLLPWFLLLGLFGFDEDPGRSVALRVLLRSPLDSSCQHLHRELCDRMAALFFPAGRPFLLSDLPWFDLDAERRLAGDGGLLCFEDVLAGTGRLNDHCGDEYHHGQVASAEAALNTYCNVGRAAIMRRFRRHMLMRLQVAEPPRTAERLVAMGEFAVSNNSADPAEFLRQFPLIRAFLREKGVGSVAADFPALPLGEQAAIVCGASAYLGICGGGAAMLSLFMRPGSLLFLSCSTLLDYEALANSGLAQPIYFDRIDAAGVASMVWDALRALDHF